MNKKWYQELLLIADFMPPGPENYEKYDVEKQVKAIKDLGFNSQHIEAFDISNGDTGIAFFETKYALEQKRDLFKDYCKQYKELGGNAIVYFNVHWLAENLCEARPDWYQRNKDGNKLNAGYGSGGTVCVNSPYRDWAFKIIKDLAKYEIKGIFLDGPGFNHKGCFCESCLSKFEKEYGFRYSADNLKNRDVFLKMKEFKRKSIIRFLKEAKSALNEINPDAIIFINSPQIGPTANGKNNNETIEWQDALLAEGGFFYSDLRSWSIWKSAATAKLLETQAQGKPAIVAMAGRWGPWSYYLLPPAEMWITYAQALSNGANIWFGIYDANRDDKRMNTVKEINNFAMSNANYFSGTESVSKTALVWSFKNADFYQATFDFEDFSGEVNNVDSKAKSDAGKAFNGWYEVLTRSHKLFDVIDDYYLENKDLSKYELIILPNIACIGQKEAVNLGQYVKNGGNIISTFDTACFDEYGEKRHDNILKDLFGTASNEGVEELAYDHVEVEKSQFTCDLEQPIIPAPYLHVKVKPASGVETVMHYREKQASRYCELPTKTEYPFLIHNKSDTVGSGSSVLFTGNIDAAYDMYRIPEYYNIMKNAVELVTSRDICIEGDITSLDVNVRKKNENYIIHLINHTSYNGRPINSVIPLKDVKISVRMDKKPENIKALRKNMDLEYIYDKGFVTVKVPEIDEYEIVVANIK